MIKAAAKTPSQGHADSVRPAWERDGCLYVLGIDGLTLDVIQPMASAGQLPNFSRLVLQGAHGPLQTVSPTNSSLLWTSIATGRHHRDHGIDGFQFYRVLGLEFSRSAMRRARKLGLKRLLKALMRLGVIKELVFDARHVRAKRFWEVLSEAGQSVVVVNWWHTWPARPVNGLLVSDRLFYWRKEALGTVYQGRSTLTYPESLHSGIQPLVTHPDHVSASELRRFVDLPDQEIEAFLKAPFSWHEVQGELRFIIASDTSYWRIFQHCVEALPSVRLAALYLRGPDIAQHCAFHYSPWARAEDVPAEDRRKYSNIVPGTYRFVDELIGRLLARLQPQDTLIVISDHGFGFQPGRTGYGHRRGCPPGALFACGPEFKEGTTISNATIYDVMPTIMRICGFPLAKDLAGRCLEEALSPAFCAKHPPVPPVPTYGPSGRHGQAPAAQEEAEKDIKEHLRALGYLD